MMSPQEAMANIYCNEYKVPKQQERNKQCLMNREFHLEYSHQQVRPLTGKQRLNSLIQFLAQHKSAHHIVSSKALKSQAGRKKLHSLREYLYEATKESDVETWAAGQPLMIYSVEEMQSKPESLDSDDGEEGVADNQDPDHPLLIEYLPVGRNADVRHTPCLATPVKPRKCISPPVPRTLMRKKTPSP